MNATVFPEARPAVEADPQSRPPLAAQDVLRYVWDGKFGSILIEICSRNGGTQARRRRDKMCLYGALTPWCTRVPRETWDSRAGRAST